MLFLKQSWYTDPQESPLRNRWHAHRLPRSPSDRARPEDGDRPPQRRPLPRPRHPGRQGPRRPQRHPPRRLLPLHRTARPRGRRGARWPTRRPAGAPPTARRSRGALGRGARVRGLAPAAAAGGGGRGAGVRRFGRGRAGPAVAGVAPALPSLGSRRPCRRWPPSSATVAVSTATGAAPRRSWPPCAATAGTAYRGDRLPDPARLRRLAHQIELARAIAAACPPPPEHVAAAGTNEPAIENRTNETPLGTNEPCLVAVWHGSGAAGACTPPPRGVGGRNEPRARARGVA